MNKGERFRTQVRKEVTEFLSDSGNMDHGGINSLKDRTEPPNLITCMN